MKLIAALSLLVLAAPAPEIRYFHSQRPVVIPGGGGGQTCLVVDASIFSHAASQLSDLRLYDGATETPYVVRSESPEVSLSENPQLLNLGTTGGQTSFDSEMPEAGYSDLQLEIEGRDFLATVTVSGRQTKTAPSSTRLGEFTIFDLTRQKLGRSTILHLPDSDFHYLHFQIVGPIKPEDVKGIALSRAVVRQPRYVSVAEVKDARLEGRDQIFEFTVPAHMPVDRLVFSPRDAGSSFSRDVEIGIELAERASTDDRSEPPQRVTHAGNILRVHTLEDGHRINEEQLSVSAPQADFSGPSKWTVRIKNHDDIPIAMATVRLEMLERVLCFDASAGKAYTLYYGDRALAPPTYDYSRLFVAEKNPPEARLGTEAANPLFQSRPDERPFTEKHPALLWVGLIVVIVLLGTVAVRSMKPASPPRS